MWRSFSGIGVFSISVCLSLAQPPDKPDLKKQPTLYVVGYAHLDTEWRWEYPQVISEYLRNTMLDNFKLFDKYPHYIFNFSGANRYRLMKEYYPADFAKVKQYVDSGRWFPAGSSMEEGDVNTPSAESIIRQILYGNDWFRKELGKASAEYMLPDCFGFPASLPTILAHSGVKGFSTQKLVWGSSAPGGGPESLEKTPEGTPFNVGVWAGPDGETVLAGLNPGSYSGDIYSDLSKPFPPLPPDQELETIETKLKALRTNARRQSPVDPAVVQQYETLAADREGFQKARQDQVDNRFQDDWAARVENNGRITGVYTDYHYYGTGDVGGAPRDASVALLEAIVTKDEGHMPPQGMDWPEGLPHPQWPAQKVGDGPVNVVSSTAEQMFLDITPSEAAALPRYTGEMELTNHSAGSLTSQAYQKRWLRKEELLADAAEKSSVAAQWLGARSYPLTRLNDAWTLVMAGQFHDLAAGTATPKAYEFAWNDDVIALNQFAGVLSDATGAVSAALDTNVAGTPVVVFNPLNIEREDIVEANIQFANGLPQAVRVIGPDGKEAPSQVSDGKVIFLAKVPSVGYAVYGVEPASGAANASGELHVSENELENTRYKIKLNADGDVASIFDKSIQRELLSAPARLAISYDNPTQWPAWNMDWDQEQSPPKAYVSGPAKIRVLENGAARVAIQVARDTAGSHFVQTIRLAAGEAGKRVEFANAIDWNTRESNLKAAFPMTASNRIATYNWDIGTIQRPTAEPKKFEVPSHQWIDLTDMSEEFGATVLTGAKNGSDKPNDNTIRLTLMRTPGVRGGFPDQATQDLGHHEFVYGFAGHVGGWRQGQTDWQADMLNDPMVAFETTRHAGALGKEFSLVKVSNPRIKVLALKKAELSDEVIVRLVELDGQPEPDVRVSFAAPVETAREVNGQEQPVGPATVEGGHVRTSFAAYQPRTFALRLSQNTTAGASRVRSSPVPLHYDLAASSGRDSKITGGFDGKGNAYPAEMLPAQMRFDDVDFQLGVNGGMDALEAKGQTIQLPAGNYNRVYLVASAIGGDQKPTFRVGNQPVQLTIEDWGGFIGQWDDRVWRAQEVTAPAEGGRPAHQEMEPYAQMLGIRPGYIKRAHVAWYCSFHHDAAGHDVPYQYSYLFAYPIALPAGVNSITLPNNPNVRVFAISVANVGPETAPAQPLYDTLGRSEPSSNFIAAGAAASQ